MISPKPGETTVENAIPTVTLNNDILHRIFRSLPQPTLAVCLRVSTTFYDIAGPLLYRSTVTLKIWDRVDTMIQAVVPLSDVETQRQGHPSRGNRVLSLLKHTKLLIVYLHLGSSPDRYLTIHQLAPLVDSVRILPSRRCSGQKGSMHQNWSVHHTDLGIKYFKALHDISSHVRNLTVSLRSLSEIPWPHRPNDDHRMSIDHDFPPIQCKESVTLIVNGTQWLLEDWTARFCSTWFRDIPFIRIIIAAQHTDERPQPYNRPAYPIVQGKPMMTSRLGSMVCSIIKFCYVLLSGSSATYEFVILDNLISNFQHNSAEPITHPTIPEALEAYIASHPLYTSPTYSFVSRFEYLQRPKIQLDAREFKYYSEIERLSRTDEAAEYFSPISFPRQKPVGGDEAVCLLGDWKWVVIDRKPRDDYVYEYVSKGSVEDQ